MKAIADKEASQVCQQAHLSTLEVEADARKEIDELKRAIDALTTRLSSKDEEVLNYRTQVAQLQSAVSSNKVDLKNYIQELHATLYL